MNSDIIVCRRIHLWSTGFLLEVFFLSVVFFSPSEGPCCSDRCQFLDSRNICRSPTTCKSASYCKYPLALSLINKNNFKKLSIKCLLLSAVCQSTSHSGFSGRAPVCLVLLNVLDRKVQRVIGRLPSLLQQNGRQGQVRRWLRLSSSSKRQINYRLTGSHGHDLT